MAVITSFKEIFKNESQDIIDSGWPQALAATLVSPPGPTSASGRTIDHSLVDSRLLPYQPKAGQLPRPLHTHGPIFLDLYLPCSERLVAKHVMPKHFPQRPLVGPAREPPPLPRALPQAVSNLSGENIRTVYGALIESMEVHLRAAFDLIDESHQPLAAYRGR